jgi:hypothetical protein
MQGHHIDARKECKGLKHAVLCGTVWIWYGVFFVGVRAKQSLLWYSLGVRVDGMGLA